MASLADRVVEKFGEVFVESEKVLRRCFTSVVVHIEQEEWLRIKKYMWSGERTLPIYWSRLTISKEKGGVFRA